MNNELLTIQEFLTMFVFNSSFACSLLRQGMKQIVITSETPEAKALEKMEDKSAAASVSQYFICFYVYFYFVGL